ELQPLTAQDLVHQIGADVARADDRGLDLRHGLYLYRCEPFPLLAAYSLSLWGRVGVRAALTLALVLQENPHPALRAGLSQRERQRGGARRGMYAPRLP